MKTYRYQHRVTFEETNFTGNVYFAHYARWQGHCRELFLAEKAPRILDLLTDGLALITVSHHVEHLRECQALDLIDVEMSLRGVRAHRIDMAFDYVRLAEQSRELVAVGAQTVACMSRTDHGLVPCPPPAELLSALRPYEPDRLDAAADA